MNKTALLIPFVFLIGQYAHTAPEVTAKAKTADLAQSDNAIRIDTRPEILGLWGMDISKKNKCTEYYNFRAYNEVVVNSAKEWSVGLFEYQPSPDNTLEKLPTLVMQIKYENNELDCSGNRVDQSGELSQYFVKWKNRNEINFCATDSGQQCFATLRRILP